MRSSLQFVRPLTVVLIALAFVVPRDAESREVRIQTLSATEGRQSFGNAIAIDSDVAVVSSRFSGATGDVTVFVRSSSDFIARAVLRPSDAAYYDFGSSVALHGDTVVVGAKSVSGGPGGAFVYVRPAAGWSETLYESAFLEKPADGSSWFGAAVGINGYDEIAVSDPLRHRVHVYARPAGGWSGSVPPIATLVPTIGRFYAHFGHALSMSGETVVTAEKQEDMSEGVVHVHVRPQGGWSGTHATTARIDPSPMPNHFGDAVAVQDDVVVVGAPVAQIALVFERPVGGWSGVISTPAAILAPSERTIFPPSFGRSVALDDGIVLVGAPRHPNSGVDRSSAYKFERPPSGWGGTLSESVQYPPTLEARFGARVAIEGRVTLISGTNRVYVYIDDDVPPTTTATLHPADPDGRDEWYLSPVEVTLRAEDDPGGSGISEIRCVLDPELPPAGVGSLCPPGSITVATDGAHTLYFQSYDLATNVEKPKALSFRIDGTTPLTSIASTPASPGGQNGWYISLVAVRVTGADATSGVAETRCILDALTAPPTFAHLSPGCAGEYVLEADGHHTIHAASEDAAGNVESVTSRAFDIDATDPVVSCAPGAVFLLRAQGAQVSASVTDATSGAESPAATAPADVANVGVRSAMLTGADVAGNTAAASCSYLVSYDLQGPLRALRPRYRAGAPIQLTFSLGDAAGARIEQGEAAAIASECRFRARFDGGAAFCSEYMPGTKEFRLNVPTPRSASAGMHSIAIEVEAGGHLVNATTIQVEIEQ